MGSVVAFGLCLAALMALRLGASHLLKRSTPVPALELKRGAGRLSGLKKNNVLS